MPTSAAPREDARLRMAYNEGFRALDIQRDDLERLRTRMVSILSAAAVSAGLFGAFLSKSHGGRAGWIYAGLIAFSVLIICAALVLAPWTWTFETDPRILLNDYVDAGRDLNDTLRWAACHAGENCAKNRQVLRWLVRLYLVSVLAFVACIGSFALAVTR